MPWRARLISPGVRALPLPISAAVLLVKCSELEKRELCFIRERCGPFGKSDLAYT